MKKKPSIVEKLLAAIDAYRAKEALWYSTGKEDLKPASPLAARLLAARTFGESTNKLRERIAVRLPVSRLIADALRATRKPIKAE